MIDCYDNNVATQTQPNLENRIYNGLKHDFVRRQQ